MRILLDTSYLHELMEAPGKLTSSEHRFLAGQPTRDYAGAVSLREMRAKFRARHRTGARNSPYDANRVLAFLEGRDVVPSPITPRYATRTPDTPIDRKDRVLELLLVQAGLEDRRLLTVDRRPLAHPLAIAP